MSKMFLTALLALWVSGQASAVIIMALDAPRDDPGVRQALVGCGSSQSNSLSRCSVVQPLTEEYQRLLGMRIFPLKRADVAKSFGPPLLTATNWWGPGGHTNGPQSAKRPADLILPIYVPSMLAVSGLHSTDPRENKNHTDLHALGKLGYLEVYYQNDGESVHTAVLYGRADKRFVPLKSPDDFEKRLAWDKARFALIQKWLDQHLPRVKDLGTVEVTESAPTRVSLDEHRTCLIKTQIMRNPNLNDDWYALTLSLDQPEAEPAKRRSVFKIVNQPNAPVVFAFDGDFFQLTPKLKK